MSDWDLIQNGAYADAVISFTDEILARPSTWASAIASASRLLRKRLRTKQSTAWPGPTSRYLLGRICESDMLAAVSDVPFLRERELCQARFYSGVQALSAGEPAAYSDAMHAAYELGRVTKVEAEYYLALHEVSTVSRAEPGATSDSSTSPGPS